MPVLCLLPAVHFNTITKGTVRYFVQFLYHSPAKMTETLLTIAVLQQKYEGSCILVQTYNGDWVQPELFRVFWHFSVDVKHLENVSVDGEHFQNEKWPFQIFPD